MNNMDNMNDMNNMNNTKHVVVNTSSLWPAHRAVTLFRPSVHANNELLRRHHHELDFSCVQPLIDAVRARYARKHKGVELLIDPVYAEGISAQGDFPKFGRTKLDPGPGLLLSVNKVVDQIGVRRAGDAWYLCIISVHNAPRGPQYYVTPAVVDKHRLGSRKLGIVSTPHALPSRKFTSPKSVAACVAELAPLTAPIMARPVWESRGSIFRELQTYFDSKRARASSAAFYNLNDLHRVELLNIALEYLRGATPGAVSCSPHVQGVLDTYRQTLATLEAEAAECGGVYGGDIHSILMVATFGDDPKGYVLSNNSANQLVVRAVESLSELPSTIVRRVQTIAVNSNNATDIIPGVGVMRRTLDANDGRVVCVVVTKAEHTQVFDVE